MNLPRFYCREALSPGALVELPEPVARHAVRVLRLPPGAPMILFDGRGGQYLAHIERIERDTDAEVVTVLAAQADDYRYIPLLWASVIALLLPGALLHSALHGPAVWLQILLASAAALLCEAAMLRARGLPARRFVLDGSALLTGALIGLTFPPLGPWWLVVVGAFFAIVVAKQLYGGLGNNLFNPAMVAFAVMMVSFPAQMSQWTPHAALSGGDQLLYVLTRDLPVGLSADALAGATPLDAVRTGLLNGQTLGVLLAGPWPVSLDQALLALAWLAGGLALGARGVLRWQAPLAMLATLTVLATLAHLLDAERYASPLFHLLAGATQLGAWFIATDPVTAPSSARGRLWFGAGIGALTWVIRTWGGYPDAVAFAVLLMNLCAPFIDLHTRAPAFGQRQPGGRR
jgi:electron transport complex protein RnfD